jgi:hypothetical protein
MMGLPLTLDRRMPMFQLLSVYAADPDRSIKTA